VARVIFGVEVTTDDFDAETQLQILNKALDFGRVAPGEEKGVPAPGEGRRYLPRDC
jgi:hypothetical protein